MALMAGIAIMSTGSRQLDASLLSHSRCRSGWQACHICWQQVVKALMGTLLGTVALRSSPEGSLPLSTQVSCTTDSDQAMLTYQ